MRKPAGRPNDALASSQPFLTDEQRAALDAALAVKRAEQPPPAVLPAVPLPLPEETVSKPALGKNPRHEAPKTKRDLAHDHHAQRKGKGLGRTKKGGGGGRFTWGSLLDEEVPAGALDRHDPNYDSSEEPGLTFQERASAQVAAYRRAVAALLAEYFAGGDVAEAALSLSELGHPEFGHYFVKRCVTLALDLHDREREMASTLLSALAGEGISAEAMRRGFTDLAASLADTELDVPGAPELLARFVCRAVVDDALPPAWVARLQGGEGTAVGELRSKCDAALGGRHGAAERLARCWGGGAGVRLDETKDAFARMLQEYRSSGDVGEVRALLRGLAVPFFHHELVKQALVAALEAGEAGAGAPLLRLLGELAASGDVSSSQVAKGFQRVADRLPDLELDCPSARPLYDTAVAAAVAGGWLEAGFAPAPVTPTAGAGANGGLGAFHPSVQAFKKAALAIIAEYFDSGDTIEVARQLAALDEPGFLNIFVKHAVQLALDRKNRERELVSQLLPALCPSTLPGEQLALGFTRLLAAAEDLALDCPDAPHLLALFLGRAIVDEALPPRFLAEAVPHLPAGSLGLAVVQQAGSLLSARHAAERLAGSWHGGALTTAQLAQQMDDLIKEYLAGGDGPEAARCLRELGAPHFGHEATLRALTAALAAPADAPRLAALLALLADSGEISQTQLAAGFRRVDGRLDDLVLDCPHARETFAQLRMQALAEGWLVDAPAPALQGGPQ